MNTLFSCPPLHLYKRREGEQMNTLYHFLIITDIFALPMLTNKKKRLFNVALLTLYASCI